MVITHIHVATPVASTNPCPPEQYSGAQYLFQANINSGFDDLQTVNLSNLLTYKYELKKEKKKNNRKAEVCLWYTATTNYIQTWELGTPKGLGKIVLNSDLALLFRSIATY